MTCGNIKFVLSVESKLFMNNEQNKHPCIVMHAYYIKIYPFITTKKLAVSCLLGTCKIITNN